jgi:uncharacterized protein
MLVIQRLSLTTILLFSFVVGSSILSVPIKTTQAKAADIPKASTRVKQNLPKRLALVIGIDDYPASPLRFPVNDAELITKQLKSANFEVILIKNPTLGELIQARKRFVEEINKHHESNGDVPNSS